MNSYLEKVLEDTKKKNINEPEFLQAVKEVLTTVEPVVANHQSEYESIALLERMVEPERIILFRVPWVNDKGEVVVNRGYRVQFSSLIGPYKGGLRFHPSVNQSIMKFLRHIGQDVDVPAGDIGVGAREIGYLFGQYKRIRNAYEGGVLTGKATYYGGSLARTEATGYGLLFFTREMLAAHNQSLQGKTVTISGSGNVAIYACEKATAMGAKVVAMSDSNGCIYDENGIDLDLVKEIKEVKRGRIKEYLEKHPNAKYMEKTSEDSPVWTIKTDIALPCATQNELTLNSAKKLVDNGVIAVAEGANMPCTQEATDYLLSKGVLVGPAKAANAGGVATSAIEMSQNSMRFYYTFEEVEAKLEQIMVNIFNACKDASDHYGCPGNYVAGANIAAFRKLAKSMRAQGIV